MSDTIKRFSVKDIEIEQDSENVDFAEVEMWAFAEGNNSHNNPIDKEVLERDAFTFKGKFLTAKFDRFTQDVKGHETDEVIIGYIDPTSKIEFKTKEVDGVEKEFAVVKGLLSKIYANDVYNMFKENNERTVSCEFSCSTLYEEDENGIPLSEDGEKMFGEENPILGYNIHSITVLGLSYKPSIRGTEIKVKKFAENNFEQVLNKDSNDNKEEKMKDNKEFSVVDISDLHWKVYQILEEKYPDGDYDSVYRIYGIYEEDGNKFAIIYTKDDDTKYKVNIYVEDDAIKLAEEMTKVELNIVETEEIKKFSSEGVDKKYLEFIEKEKDKEEDVVMSEEPKVEDEKEEPKEMSEEDDKSDDEDDKDEVDDKNKDDDDDDDKKFSLGEFVTLSLEEETDEIKEYVQEKVYSMSADEIVGEIVSLKKFMEAQNVKEKEFKLGQIMANVKEDLDEKKFSELQEEGKSLSLDELNGFENKVKAFAYESTKKNKKEDNEIMKFGGVVEEQKNKAEEVTADDIFNKYL